MIWIGQAVFVVELWLAHWLNSELLTLNGSVHHILKGHALTPMLNLLSKPVVLILYLILTWSQVQASWRLVLLRSLRASAVGSKQLVIAAQWSGWTPLDNDCFPPELGFKEIRALSLLTPLVPLWALQSSHAQLIGGGAATPLPSEWIEFELTVLLHSSTF
jgi:hypothetical protein